MRKLVTIQEVNKVFEIPNCDNIVGIGVQGWSCVTQRSNNLKVGDKILYFEIDSFIPEIPTFEFLRKDCFRTHADGSTGFKIRTMRFRGQISQGFAMPLNTMSELGMLIRESEDAFFTTRMEGNTLVVISIPINIGEDFTSILGVKKFEKPIPPGLDGKVEGEIPSSLATDEIRVQILQPLLDQYEGTLMYLTEKLDGSSTTMYIDADNVFRVCGRQWQWANDGTNAMWNYAIEHDIETKLRSLPFRAAISGEIVGNGIQSNIYKIDGYKIYFYSLVDIEKHERVGFEAFRDTMVDLKLLSVPLVLQGWPLTKNMDEIVSMAKGPSALRKETGREGLVFRPMEAVVAPGFELPHDMLSFKSISPEFLLKHDD